MILTACQWLASPPALVWEMFLQFLFLRIQHFLLQGRPLTRRQTQFLHPMMHNLVRFVHLALRHSGQFLLPPDQWRQRGAHQAYRANCSPEAPGRAIESLRGAQPRSAKNDTWPKLKEQLEEHDVRI